MHIVHVFIQVKPEFIEAFKDASIDNAQNSIKEPGITRFDVIQQTDDPSRFALVEVYHSPGDQAKHRETSHYHRWREAVEPMMAEARRGVIFTNVFPGNEQWG